MKYSGKWNKNDDKNWIPSIKNEKITNQSVFFISFPDLLKSFSLLYICKVRPIENGHNPTYKILHFKKDETAQPNLSKLEIEEPTNVVLQLHQHSQGRLVTAFMLIADSQFNYINSIASNDENLTLELPLEKGTYLIYTDIIYRYLSKSFTKGYYLSAYGNSLQMDLEKLGPDFEESPNVVLNAALYSYSEFNNNNQGNNDTIFGVKYYQNKKQNLKFPFVFIIFETDDETEAKIKFYVDNMGSPIKNYAYYNEDEDLNTLTDEGQFILDKNMDKKEIKIFKVLRLKNTFDFECDFRVEPNLEGDELSLIYSTLVENRKKQ